MFRVPDETFFFRLPQCFDCALEGHHCYPKGCLATLDRENNLCMFDVEYFLQWQLMISGVQKPYLVDIYDIRLLDSVQTWLFSVNFSFF